MERRRDERGMSPGEEELDNIYWMRSLTNKLEEPSGKDAQGADQLRQEMADHERKIGEPRAASSAHRNASAASAPEGAPPPRPRPLAGKAAAEHGRPAGPSGTCAPLGTRGGTQLQQNGTRDEIDEEAAGGGGGTGRRSRTPSRSGPPTPRPGRPAAAPSLLRRCRAWWEPVRGVRDEGGRAAQEGGSCSSRAGKYYEGDWDGGRAHGFELF